MGLNFIRLMDTLLHTTYIEECHSMSDEIVVFVTASSEDEARTISNALVGQKLAACANIVPSVNSIFTWQGQVCQEGEVLIMLKSVRPRLDSLIEMVKEMHSYEVPEIIALPVIAGSKEYLEWVRSETGA
jgi:periplasmic divalent cation tolerance protein